MDRNGNTVGSLTEVQQHLIIGSLLGDGYMSCKTHAYLKIGHSLKQQAYVDWKYSFLSPFVLTQPHAYKGNGSRIGYRFFTRSLPLLTPYYQRFYGQERTKKIPADLQLIPFSLAIWYMDDGAQNRKSAYLNTQQFDLSDQMKLLQLLQEQFGLSARLNRDKQYLRIRFLQDSAQKLKHIIAPLMPSFMHYKLPL